MRKLFVIRNTVVAALLMAVLIASTSVYGEMSKVNSLRLEQGKSGTTNFIISKSGAVDVQDFTMDDPPRLVLDFVGATHELHTSEFEGDGTFVEKVRTSQFTNEPDMVTRVVFDLRGKAQYRVLKDEQFVTVQFYSKDPAERPESARRVMESSVDPMEFASAVAQPVEGLAGDETKPVKTTPAKPEQANPLTSSVRSDQNAPTETPPNKSQSDTAKRPSWQKTAPTTPATPIAVGPETPDFQSYAASSGLVKNRNITIDVQGADIQTVLRSFSEFSTTNIIAGPEVEGKVTAHLVNMPWRQAMEVILKSHGFGFREEYGVIRVSTIEKLTKEELELQAAERQKDELLPLETRIINVSFANASEIRDALKEMLSQRGSMETESGANALVVTDISKNIDKINAMVDELDRKIKQVEIVAKMVDVDFEATREIGVRWDLLNLSHPDISGVGDFVIDAGSPAPTGRLRVGTVQSWGDVQSVIDMLEKENKANIISNPRIVTADNREASILVGKEIPLIVSDEAGNPITELTKIGITLRVTPHVNSDKTITLDLHPEVSDLSAQATVQGGVVIVLSEADTRVVVGDGETAVIGGLISEVESKLENGVPLLKDIPIVGGLFRLTNDTTKKRELVIFVTPRIVDG
ncbi:MAG: AMIN domain-containing protein [Candidatus Latescibacterota bacterium]|nr:MAG: AMIN domain-containing protein [Candidatus Latescibacterota bacterium]